MEIEIEELLEIEILLLFQDVSSFENRVFGGEHTIGSVGKRKISEAMSTQTNGNQLTIVFQLVSIALISKK